MKKTTKLILIVSGAICMATAAILLIGKVTNLFETIISWVKDYDIHPKRVN